MTTSDIYQYNISFLDQYALLIALSLVMLAVAIYLGRSKLEHVWLNIKTRHHLNRLGLKQISNFQCPDGLGHYFNIDRLVMRHDGISLLVFKQYPGSIFCADNIDEWTQLLAGKSYRFKNPLVELDFQVKAVSTCMPDVPVDGYLLFGQQTEFPKGHPDRVICLDKIPEALMRSEEHKVQASVESAWKKLSTLEQEN